MKFRIQLPDFLKSVTACTSVVPQKSTLPILESLLLDFTENELKVTGTDLTTAIEMHLSCKGKTNYSACLNARQLLNLLKQFKSGEVLIDFDPKLQRAVITIGDGEYKLPTQKSEEFPSLKELAGDGEKIQIPLSTLVDCIDHTLYAVSTDDLRPAMNGVLCKIEKQVISMVSTDGHRLSHYQHNGLATGELKSEFIVPTDALIAIKSIFAVDAVTIQYSKTALSISGGGATLLTRLIDEPFPAWESVIPEDGKFKLVANRAELLSTVTRVSLFSNSLTHQLRMHLSEAGVSVSAEDVDARSEATEKVTATYTGDEIEMGFNAKFVVDALKNVTTETVTFTIKAPTSAAIMETLNPDEVQKSLLMPVRLGV